MVFGVVDEAVVGKHQPLGAAAVLAHRVDVALGVAAPVGGGQQPFVVAKAAAAQRRALAGVGLDVAAAPTGVFGLALGDVVVRQPPIEVQVEGDLLLGVVPAVLQQCNSNPTIQGTLLYHTTTCHLKPHQWRKFSQEF